MKVHEEFNYEVRTIIGNKSLDLTKENDGKKSVRFVQPCGYGAKIQGKSKGIDASTLSHYSTTGVYTGVDAECADLTGTEMVNFDKVFVSSASACPVRVYIIGDERV